MGGVAIVTDATADLPSGIASDDRLTVVPLTVAFGDEVHTVGPDSPTAEFYARLAGSEVVPTTAQPPPAAFGEAYAACAAAGFDAVLSVHCSAELSGTAGVARAMAVDAPVDVRVLDSRLVGGALGIAVRAAQRAASAGGDLRTCATAVAHVSDHVLALLVVDTLEYLRRGGRLTGAQAVVGTALRVRPILQLADGRIGVRERARTWSGARDRVLEIVADGPAPVELAVVHADRPERAAELAGMLGDRFGHADVWQAEMGPVIGAHVGPGAIGVAAVGADPAADGFPHR